MKKKARRGKRRREKGKKGRREEEQKARKQEGKRTAIRLIPSLRIFQKLLMCASSTVPE
jgi:hypothetical protein